MASSNERRYYRAAQRWRQKYRDLRTRHAATEENLASTLEALDATEEQRAEYEAQLGDLEGQLDAEPSEQSATIARLTKELRTLKARGTYEKLAGEHRVRPDALDDLWERLGLELDDDEGPDEEDLKARIAEALEKRPYLRGDDQAPAAARKGAGQGQGRNPAGLAGLGDGGSAPPRKPQLPEPPGGGRGDRSGGGSRSVEEIVNERFAATGRTDPARIA